LIEGFNPVQRWFGGFYELAIQVGAHGNDAAILDLIDAIWSQPEITGPYEENNTEPSIQQFTSISSDERHYYGFIRLNDEQLLVCGTYVVKENCEPGGSDWVLFYVPAQEVQWKLGGSGNCGDIVLPELSLFVNYCVGIADAAYERKKFQMALIGFEASGETYAETITASEVGTPWMGVILPKEHSLVKEIANGQQLSSGLVWYAPQSKRV
jgi:hypothetical protein